MCRHFESFALEAVIGTEIPEKGMAGRAGPDMFRILREHGRGGQDIVRIGDNRHPGRVSHDASSGRSRDEGGITAAGRHAAVQRIQELLLDLDIQDRFPFAVVDAGEPGEVARPFIAADGFHLFGPEGPETGQDVAAEEEPAADQEFLDPAAIQGNLTAIYLQARNHLDKVFQRRILLDRQCRRIEEEGVADGLDERKRGRNHRRLQQDRFLHGRLLCKKDLRQEDCQKSETVSEGPAHQTTDLRYRMASGPSLKRRSMMERPGTKPYFPENTWK